MLISRKKFPTVPDMPLLLHNLPLSKVNTFKYLGVLLAEDLAWNPHIQSICSKARQVLGLLYRRFYNYSNTDTLEKLCVSSTSSFGICLPCVGTPHSKGHSYTQEHMSRPKGGEGASDCVHDVLVEVLSIALPYMDRVLREKRVVVYHSTTTHRLH